MPPHDPSQELSFDPLPSNPDDLIRRRTFGRNRRAWETIRVSLLIDIVAILVALSIAIAEDKTPGQLPVLAIMLVGWIFIIWTQRGYTFHSRIQRVGMRSTFVASVIVLSITGFWSVLVDEPQVMRSLVLIGIPLGTILLLIGRVISSEINKSLRRRRPSKLLLLGRVRDINDILGRDPSSRFPFHEVSAILVTDPQNLGLLQSPPNCKVEPFLLGKSIGEAASEEECDSVWVASVNDFGHKNLRRLMWSLREQNIRLYLEPMIEGTSGTRINSERIGPRASLHIEPPRFDAANGYAKRFVDVVLSAAILMLVSPVFLATAIAIKLEDGGPVFYKSERIGIYGNPYKVWKFRSMAEDADKRAQALIDANGGGALLFKMKDDPRVTRVGKFIRKYSIDELPQFFNTLNGTMSIVGPRPQVQREVNEYDIDMRMRLEVRPGITGLWQVSGRSDLSPAQAQALDLYYVDNWSPLLDLKIFFQTFRAVLRSEGAY